MAGPSPIAALPGRLEYCLKAAIRLTWYSSQAAAIRRAVGRLDPDQVKARDRSPDNDEPEAPSADRAFMLRDIAGLFARDLANVEAGLYPMPNDDPGGLPAMIRRSRQVMADLPAVAERRRDGAHQLPEIGAEAAHLPRYYRQNFHFQSDGWLSDKSAELYDTQVEILFSGAAAAMRRQVLLPIADMLRGVDQRERVAADIACGSGLLVARHQARLAQAAGLWPRPVGTLSAPRRPPPAQPGANRTGGRQCGNPAARRQQPGLRPHRLFTPRIAGQGAGECCQGNCAGP